MRVREAELGDAAAISVLIDQLGYSMADDVLADRIRTSSERNDASWVAVDDEAHVIGFAAGHFFWPFELDSPVAELTALIVDDSQRRQGCGQVLVRAFETWAIKNDCVRMSVATAFHRTQAHAFYESLGYAQHARKYEKNP